MLQIELNDLKNIFDVEIGLKSISMKKFQEIILNKKNKKIYQSNFPEVFEKYLEKKVFNQNRFIVKTTKQNIEEYLNMLLNLSFYKHNLDKTTVFHPAKMKIEEKDLNICLTMIRSNITHSLKIINTNLNNGIYKKELCKSSYGIDSSVIENNLTKMPFSTTEGNATTNSKYPIFFHNFIYEDKVFNFIEFATANKKLAKKVLLNYIDKSQIDKIFNEIEYKKDIVINGNLGYQTIIDISNENDKPHFINISPTIPIFMLHKINNVNKEYLNNIIENENSKIKKEDKTKDGEESEEISKYFLRRESYLIGGTQPQNVNPYFSFQAGVIQAFLTSLPDSLSIDGFERDMSKIHFKHSLLKNIYLKKEEYLETVKVIEGLYSIEKKDNSSVDIRNKVLKRLLMFVPQITSEINYLRENYTFSDYELYLKSLMEKSSLNEDDLKSDIKLNKNEFNLIFGAKNKEDKSDMRAYIEEELERHIYNFLNKLNISTINANSSIRKSLVEKLIEIMKKELGVY